MYSANETRIAQRFLPHVRDIPHHPDSMKAVKVVEKEHTVEFQMETSFGTMLRHWSATWESQSTSSSSRGLPYRSFATLWSLDLSVASLQAEEGVQGLTKDVALRRIRERKAGYDSTLQVDVYRYHNSPRLSGDVSEMQLTGAGQRVVLRDDERNEYRPIQSESTPIREGFVQGGGVLYRRNTFLFDRVVEGKDILNNVEELRLWVRGFGDDYYFSWSFDQVSTASSQ